MDRGRPKRNSYCILLTRSILLTMDLDVFDNPLLRCCAFCFFLVALLLAGFCASFGAFLLSSLRIRGLSIVRRKTLVECP